MQAATKLEICQWMKALLYVGIFFALFLLSTEVFASDGSKFQSGGNDVEKELKGGYTRFVSFVGLIIGVLIVIVYQNWKAVLGALGVVIFTPIFVQIVNATYSALI